MIKSSLIYIIILNWNGKKDTLECLSSVVKIKYPCFKIIVVDNGSSDDSVISVQKEFPEIRVIETGENLGFAEGNNVGIQLAMQEGADAVLLLNNDTVVDPELLSAFAKAVDAYPDAGIFGGGIYLYNEQARLDHFGGNWNPKKAAFDFIGFREKNLRPDSLVLDYVCGAAMLVKREVFERIGLLDPRFFLIWEEADFCMRAKRAGFLSRTVPSALLWHKVSASFVGKKPHTNYYWWRNRLLWIEKSCSFSEKCKLSIKLFREVFHMCKLLCLKTLQLPFTAKNKREEKRKKLLQYRAALWGVRDYLLRRFGQGPNFT